MKFRLQFGIALLLSAVLGLSGLYVYKHPDTLRDKYHALSERCTIDENICLALLSPLKILSDTAFEIKRKHVSLQKLPILRIYMSDGALKKIQDKRRATLDEKRQILLNEKDDWVKATVMADAGEGAKKAKVHLRLKGDWADHLHNGYKLSFRIKVRKKETILGMNKFSIQAPKTRLHHLEPLMLDMMRDQGVLAPRYFFVDVRINDMKVGVMALEEHFTKQLVESQQRREGPIVAVDEDSIWRQRHLNHNRSSADFGTARAAANITHYRHSDLPIKAFKAGRFDPYTIRGQQNIRAMSLLRDYIDQTVPASEVFDMEKLSRWWIVTNIWRGVHGAATHNLRFYFNPVTGLLEPIAFDNEAHPRGDKSLRIDNVATKALVNNNEFRQAVFSSLNDIAETMLSEEFEALFAHRQKEYLENLAIDGIILNKLFASELRLSLAHFIRGLDSLFATLPPPAKNAGNVVARSNASDRIIYKSPLLKLDSPLHTHLRSFVYWSPDQADIEIKNLTLHPVQIKSVYFEAHPDTNLWTGPDTLPAYTPVEPLHIYTQRLESASQNFNDPLMIHYEYKKERYTRPVVLQFRDSKSGFPDQDHSRKWFEEHGVVEKTKGKTIVFPPGQYLLDENLQTEIDWKVVLLPGVELELKKGAVFKVNGPLYSLGDKSDPVKISIQSSIDKGLLGSWGGVFVQSADKESHIRHTIVSGDNRFSLPNRQDSSGLTGCVTFYKSNVQIKQSDFRNLQCEDALNIISSEFLLNGVTIDGAHADALDSDFSLGTISASTFIRAGNDGVDVSGSDVKISASTFKAIGDKAISAGEKSILHGEDLSVTATSSGIVSKDSSVVSIEGAKFKDIEGSALFTYVKKQEFGPSELHCLQCTFVNVDAQATEQFGSRISLDGKDINTTPFTRKQLRAADYIQ